MAEIKPVRLQLSRKAGFRLQEHSRAVNNLPAANVARPSMWGNPFKIGSPSGCEFKDDGDPTPMIASLTREQVVEFYRDACRGFLSPEMHPWGHRWVDAFRRRYIGMSPAEAARCYLNGHNLACRCEPDEVCHADVLLELAAPAPLHPRVDE